jgi:copper transport protein
MRTRAVILPAVAAALACPSAAGAHATLTGGQPDPGGVVATAPHALTIRFDEPVDPALAVLRVADARGRRYDSGPLRSAPGHGVRVALRGRLPDGRYTVLYRVVTDDGHTIPGGFGFAVGRDASPPPAQLGGAWGPSIGAASGLEPAAGVARAVRDAMIATSAGALLFAALVWLAALAETAGGTDPWRRASRAFAARLRRLLAIAGLLGALAAGAAIVLAGASARGGSIGAALDPDVVRAVLRTRFGTATAAAGALLLALSAAAVVSGRRRSQTDPAALVFAQLGATGLVPAPARATRRLTVAAAIGALALTVLPVLGGHALTRAHPALLTATGTLHVLAAAAWLGGIVVLLLAVPAATRELAPVERTALLSAVLRRFSALAGLAVAVLALTGAVQALVEVGSWSALAHTAFGRSVVIKAGLLLVLCGVAAAHRLEHLPDLSARLRAGASPGPVRGAVRRTLRVEAVGLVAVFSVTGALAGYAPPGGARPAPAHISAGFQQATLNGTLTPARRGANTLSFVLARPEGGTAFDDLERVRIVARGPGGAAARVDVRARRDGNYRVPLRLTARGTWRLTVTLRVDTFNSFTRTTRVTVH